MLYRQKGSKLVLVVPDVDDLRAKVIYEHHDTPTGGHLGAYRVL